MTKKKTTLELPDMVDRNDAIITVYERHLVVDASMWLILAIQKFSDKYIANLNQLLNDFCEFVQTWLFKISTRTLIKFFLLIIIY